MKGNEYFMSLSLLRFEECGEIGVVLFQRKIRMKTNSPVMRYSCGEARNLERSSSILTDKQDYFVSY